MEIGSMSGIKSLSNRPMDKSQPADSVSKGIRTEISEARRQKQSLSSKDDLPVAEKAKKRQELQQEISGLNRELRQRQAETRKEQQREALANESLTEASGTGNAAEKNIDVQNTAPKDDAIKNTEANALKAQNAGLADAQDDNARITGPDAKKAGDKASEDKASRKTASEEKDTKDKASQLQDFDIPQKEWKAVITSDSSREQARKQDAVIARIEGGIAILKSEIRLDEARGADVEKKQEELKKQEEKLQKAATAQLPGSDPADRAAQKAFPIKTGKTADASNENEQAAQPPLFKEIGVSLTV